MILLQHQVPVRRGAVGPLLQATLRTGLHQNAPSSHLCFQCVLRHVNTTVVLLKPTLPPTHRSCGLASNLHLAALPPPLVPSGGDIEVFGASVKVCSFITLCKNKVIFAGNFIYYIVLCIYMLLVAVQLTHCHAKYSLSS